MIAVSVEQTTETQRRLWWASQNKSGLMSQRVGHAWLGGEWSRTQTWGTDGGERDSGIFTPGLKGPWQERCETL